MWAKLDMRILQRLALKNVKKMQLRTAVTNTFREVDKVKEVLGRCPLHV